MFSGHFVRMKSTNRLVYKAVFNTKGHPLLNCIYFHRFNLIDNQFFLKIYLIVVIQMYFKAINFFIAKLTLMGNCRYLPRTNLKKR